MGFTRLLRRRRLGSSGRLRLGKRLRGARRGGGGFGDRRAGKFGRRRLGGRLRKLRGAVHGLLRGSDYRGRLINAGLRMLAHAGLAIQFAHLTLNLVAKVPSDTTQLGHGLAHGAGNLGQLVRPKHDQRDEKDYDQMGNTEHVFWLLEGAHRPVRGQCHEGLASANFARWRTVPYGS